ncbi:MAG: hypothetical protein ACYDCK_03170 [Thermoplasmatota archaeon]
MRLTTVVVFGLLAAAFVVPPAAALCGGAPPRQGGLAWCENAAYRLVGEERDAALEINTSATNGARVFLVCEFDGQYAPTVLVACADAGAHGQGLLVTERVSDSATNFAIAFANVLA